MTKNRERVRRRSHRCHPRQNKIYGLMRKTYHPASKKKSLSLKAYSHHQYFRKEKKNTRPQKKLKEEATTG